ncbi:protein SEY1, partial [Lecanoromycetidae sp. Uapishka_2]
MSVNGHFANMGEKPTKEQYEHGIQVINADQEFNPTLPNYLAFEKVAPAGFNYHLISVFGSQSTGKSTLLNHLFGTDFGVMSEDDRRQTTKGIWMSKNKRDHATKDLKGMADNILVMDVEGTDGRERGEDQDFERKSALFALATSEVLIVNIWEHQVGLYQGANMGLLKVVFEVNLDLFLKGNKSNPRSLLFFVIRDHLGTTPLANLRNTLVQDLSRIWSGLNKPPGLEKSKIEDYFDFAFAALPHKILQPEKFVSEVSKLAAAHKSGVNDFSDAVSAAVKAGQKKGASYDFAEIVDREKKIALSKYDKEARGVLVEGAPWSNYKQEMSLYQKDLSEVSGRLRRDEMRRLATRVERWVRSRLGESVGLEFNALGSGRGGSGAPETGERGNEKEIWDRIWGVFTKTVEEAEQRFTSRAKSFDASAGEVDVGLWRLRRKSWGVLRAKIDEEMMEGNLLLKLRENFEDKFRYDEAGVPRIWRPTDDIEGIYTKARESTLTLIPLLSRFQSSQDASPPPLDDFIGNVPPEATPADEEDLTPIGGVDEDEGKSLEEEMTVLSDTKRQDIITRFKKTADGVYVEAKRSAIGGMTQVPLYFYGILFALGWNEIVAVLRNPVYFVFLLLLGAGAYVTYTLNLWGPMYQMANAASAQALEEGKKRLREFLEESNTGRQAVAMSGQEDIVMRKLNGHGKAVTTAGDDEDEDI